MAFNKVTLLLKWFGDIRNKCQKSRYQLNVNVGLIFLGCTFDLLNVASMISLIDDLAKTYNISYTTASWSLTSYAVTFAGFIACMGRFGDIVGNSVLFTISCSLFAILSLLCAVMPNFPAFAVFRAIQGICAAGLVPCAYALIPILAPKEKVQTYFSIVSCGFSSTIGLGLIVGGAFAATKIGYRGIFYLTFAVILNKKPEKDQVQTSVKSLDFIGSLIFVTGSILIVVGLTEGGESWNRPVTYVTLIIGIILFFGFFVWNCTYAKIVRGIRCVGIDTSKYFEKVQLLIPVDVLFMKNFIPIVLAFALNNACLFSCLYIIDQYSQYAERDSPLLAGVKLVPLIICMVVGNALCAFESTKLKPRVGVALGFFLALAGSVILIQLHLVKEDVFWKIFFQFPSFGRITVGGAPDQSKGIASGVSQTFGQLGIEITFSVMASVLGNINEMKGRTDAVQKFRTGFQNCSYFTVAVGALGFLVTAICIRDIHPPNDDNSDLESSIHRTKIEIDQEKSGSEGEA
ncbi:BCN_G0018090.mRNA.1.CDS.1 [Saccharomyces cerevisiae]|nr:BCN_G0018090.mRNA.1.CDS.1 [Saccharomyces cerevisiae]CAI7159654.1 BCN_G0018090.mRNA.1.CDS.1 [Saccharomyces cerevisiae]